MEKIKLPSQFQIEDEVDLDFKNSKTIKLCTVIAVHFYESKVKYDILIPVGFKNQETIIQEVDSDFVVPPSR